jgi:hypothetical protein
MIWMWVLVVLVAIAGWVLASLWGVHCYRLGQKVGREEAVRQMAAW